MRRSIKKLHSPVRDDIGDLRTFRALPTPSISHLDPFLFLNHHGHQIYPPHNRGLPFGPHPHRGFETVTFIIRGDIAHRDSAGHESVIEEGGIQWMTAGKGLVHEEVSSAHFKKVGGELEILQLWINLPSHLKMTTPRYIGLAENEIPAVDYATHKIKIISGEKGAIKTLFPITLMTIEFRPNVEIVLKAPQAENIFFYLIKGSIDLSDTPKLIEFNSDGDEIKFTTLTDGMILYGHALPHNEPIVSYGPFVMNTREEIMEAIKDYEEGRLR